MSVETEESLRTEIARLEGRVRRLTISANQGWRAADFLGGTVRTCAKALRREITLDPALRAALCKTADEAEQCVESAERVKAQFAQIPNGRRETPEQGGHEEP